MALIHRCLALILMLAVILSGAESAVARAEMASALYPVICGENTPGAEPLAIDVTGKPIPAHHSCPHCLAAGALAPALPPTPPVLLAAVGAPCAAEVLPGPALPLGLPLWHRPAATGPPLPV